LTSSRLVIGSFVGLGIVAGGLLALTKIVANPVTEFQSKSTEYWRESLISGNAAASNRANVVLNTEIIPKLTAVALNDTNDSSFKLVVANALNKLPGMHMQVLDAPGRRANALKELEKFGPAARSAVPVLILIVKDQDDESMRGAAAEALGKIHSDPDVVIPALIPCLDSDADDLAAEALGNYGPLAKAAVPKMLSLLLRGDKEARRAVLLALPKIDPENAAKAGITRETFVLLQTHKSDRAEAVKAWTAEIPK
jgi:HEAT repeat protein